MYIVMRTLGSSYYTENPFPPFDHTMYCIIIAYAHSSHPVATPLPMLHPRVNSMLDT